MQDFENEDEDEDDAASLPLDPTGRRSRASGAPGLRTIVDKARQSMFSYLIQLAVSCRQRLD
jgi:hypothetical protein